jgi:hypothetical protein
MEKLTFQKWWRYNDVGRFAHRTYCYGKFFYTVYRHGMFRTIGRYVAAPALWGGVYGVSLIPDLVNNTRAKIPDCKRGERRDIRVRARALGLLVAFHPLCILHTVQYINYGAVEVLVYWNGVLAFVNMFCFVIRRCGKKIKARFLSLKIKSPFFPLSSGLFSLCVAWSRICLYYLSRGWCTAIEENRGQCKH